VVEDAIEIKKSWDARVGRDIKKDIRSTVSVEFFKYNNYSRCIGSFGVEADIVAYIVEEDIALLKLRDEEKEAEHVAHLFPFAKIDSIHIFDKIYACGAALGHPPIQTRGEITFMDDEIDNFKYWMSSALIIYGNSGGSVFRYTRERDIYEFVGIPSRVTVSFAGFSANPITHMGYFIPIQRVYKFLDVNCYQFIYNNDFTIEQCRDKRDKMKEKEIARLERQLGLVEESESLDDSAV